MPTHKSEFAWRDGDIDVCPAHNIVPVVEVVYWKEGTDPTVVKEKADLIHYVAVLEERLGIEKV